MREKRIKSENHYYQFALSQELPKPRRWAKRMFRRQWRKLLPGKAVKAMARSLKFGLSGFSLTVLKEEEIDV